MSEHEDALGDLTPTRVLEGVRWAARTSAARVMDDFDADTGYDQGWIGYSFHKLLKDRLDRVFACGKFAVASPEQADEGLDVLGAGLSQADVETMPDVAPGVVLQDDLNGSPGWRSGEWRWLLASCRYGEVDRIPWQQKSPTKQRVAAQPAPGQLTFDAEQMGMPGLADVLADLSNLRLVPTTTLILGHALDPDTGNVQLPFGRPRLHADDEDCWYWRQDLLQGQDPGGGAGRAGAPDAPNGPAPSDVPDAPVRLRRPGKSADGAGPQQ